MKPQFKLTILFLLFVLFTGACGGKGLPPTQNPVTPSQTTSAPPGTTPAPTSAVLSSSCAIGTALREETAPILEKYKDYPAMVMSATTGLAATDFPKLEGWLRILGAPNLQDLQSKAQAAQQQGIPYEGLAYGLETGKSTPDSEWQDLVGSTQKARDIANQYGKLLVMGPGYQLMSQNTDKYTPMAALADVWVFQTQKLQADPPGQTYRQNVQNIVDLIKAGNPKIKIWAQITLPPNQTPDAAYWLSYRDSIKDIVDGTYLGVYTWGTEDTNTLVSVIETVYSTCASGQ